jgi:hypothetical protein
VIGLWSELNDSNPCQQGDRLVARAK